MIFLKRKNSLNVLLICIIILLLSLIAEISFPNSSFGFKKLKEVLSYDTNIMRLSKYYTGFDFNKEEETVSFECLEIELSNYSEDTYFVESKNQAVYSLTNGVVTYVSNDKIVITNEDNKYEYQGFESKNVLLYSQCRSGQIIGVCDTDYMIKTKDTGLFNEN